MWTIKDPVKDSTVGSAYTPAPEAAVRLPPGQAVASATLAEDIEAAVVFAMEAARRATNAFAAAAAKNGEQAASRDSHVAPRGACTSAAQSPPFCFRRLHITGLGNGGARGEPLAALKTALSRHLPALLARSTGASNSVGGGIGISRPLLVSADATEHFVAGGVCSTAASIIGRKDVVSAISNDPTPSSTPPTPPCDRHSHDTGDNKNEHVVVREAGNEAATTKENGPTCNVGEGRSGAMYYIDDGCYGSLSGALLRAEPVQPIPLVDPRRQRSPTGPYCSKRRPDDDNVTYEYQYHYHHRQQEQRGEPTAKPPGTAASSSGDKLHISAAASAAPCTIWGPTCDGLDCVSRVTLLPAELRPGRDWLFFPERGMRAGADVSGFNGLRPLESIYCVRQSGASLSAAPFERQ
ncbi:unnamed protein product [Sphacelaria rigidula]